MVVDPPATNREVVQELELAFPILADPSLAAVDAYGLRHRAAHEGQDIALSASVLIDGAGVVRWTSVTDNVRVRPRPEQIFEALDGLRARAG